MPVAIPLAMTAANVIGGALASRKNKQEKAGLAGQQQNMQALTGAGNQAMNMSRDQYSLASPAYGQALGYYTTLLNGNRARMSQAVAGPTASITDIYRGAQRGLERGMVRGGARDLASAELNRDQAGQLARLTTGIQPMAAASLADMGNQGLNRAGQFMNTGINAFNGGAGAGYNLAQQGLQQRQVSNQIWGNVGNAIGGIWAPYLNRIASGGGTLPSTRVPGTNIPYGGPGDLPNGLPPGTY